MKVSVSGLLAVVWTGVVLALGCVDESEKDIGLLTNDKSLIDYENGGCAYECSWGEGDCIWNLRGEPITGTCGRNQTCCYVGEPAKPQWRK